MKPREQFVAAYVDELVGLLVRSFAETEGRGDNAQAFAARGKAMIDAIKAAHRILGRIYDELPKPPANTPAQPTKGAV